MFLTSSTTALYFEDAKLSFVKRLNEEERNLLISYPSGVH
jgi:hypothetical protein